LEQCKKSLESVKELKSELNQVSATDSLLDGRIADADRSIRKFHSFIVKVKGAEDAKQLLEK